MFNIRYFNMDILANYFKSNINVIYINEANAILDVIPTELKPVSNEIEVEKNNMVFHHPVYIHVTPQQIFVHGAYTYEVLNEIAIVIENNMHDLRQRKYSQDLAYNSLRRNVAETTARVISTLAKELKNEPNLDISDGYYDTLGERAFFRLVEEGRVSVEDAYEYVYDVKEK